MLNAIGLSLDLVGAGMLSIGLFNKPRWLLLGWSRSPEDTARDWAYGFTGFAFLSSGFALQALPSFGVEWQASACSAVAAAVIVVVVGGLMARLLQQTVFAWRHHVAKRQAKEMESRADFPPQWDYSLRFRPQWWPYLRLWERVEDAAPPDPPPAGSNAAEGAARTNHGRTED